MNEQNKHKIYFTETEVDGDRQEFTVLDEYGFLCNVVVTGEKEPWKIDRRRAGFEPNINAWCLAENAKASLTWMVNTGRGEQCKPLWGMTREEVNEIFDPSNGNEDDCPHISEDDWVEFVGYCQMEFSDFQDDSIYETLGTLHSDYLRDCKE